MPWITRMCTRPTFCTGRYLRTLRTSRRRGCKPTRCGCQLIIWPIFFWKLHENERNWTQKGEMHLINLLVKVGSCARKRGVHGKRECAIFTTCTVFIRKRKFLFVFTLKRNKSQSTATAVEKINRQKVFVKIIHVRLPLTLCVSQSASKITIEKELIIEYTAILITIIHTPYPLYNDNCTWKVYRIARLLSYPCT